jgi:hypothetical protein
VKTEMNSQETGVAQNVSKRKAGYLSKLTQEVVRSKLLLLTSAEIILLLVQRNVS